MRFTAKTAATTLAAIIVLSLAAVACGGLSSSGGRSTAQATSMATAVASSGVGMGTASGSAPDATDATSPAAELLVLGTDTAGNRGLWRLASPGRWSLVLPAPVATAVARFGDAVALAGPGYVQQTVLGAEPRTTTLPLSWSGAASDNPITALDRAPGGKLAIVTMGEGGPGYLVAGADGVVRRLTPTPAAPFAPVVAWLDDARLLALSTDSVRASRLVEVDVEIASFGRVGTVAGVRDFAISGDRATIAVATSGEILVGSVEESLGSGQPRPVAAVPEGSVAWALALDWSGGRLALLEAIVAADGTATGSHVLVFVKTGESWVLRLDTAVPLTAISGVIWTPVA